MRVLEKSNLFNRTVRIFGIFIFLVLCVAACKQNTATKVSEPSENTEAKKKLQGIWLDENDNVAFRVKGDSIFYPDSTSISVAFRIIGDSVVIGNVKYKIEKQDVHLFWMKNQNGDVVKYSKTDGTDYLRYFNKPKVEFVTYTSVHKTDTVVMWQGERYHAYIAINPTRYRVVRNVLNDDGVEVGNVYYDNIIHISVFNGAAKVFSKDFRKHHYGKFIPEGILSQSILNNIEFSHADNSGLHFYTSVCIPDAASCYVLDTRITYAGKLFIELLDR